MMNKKHRGAGLLLAALFMLWALGPPAWAEEECPTPVPSAPEDPSSPDDTVPPQEPEPEPPQDPAPPQDPSSPGGSGGGESSEPAMGYAEARAQAEAMLPDLPTVYDITNPGVVYSTLNEGVNAWRSSMKTSTDQYGNEMVSTYDHADRPDYVPASLQSFLLQYYSDHPTVGLAYGMGGVQEADRLMREARNDQIKDIAEGLMGGDTAPPDVTTPPATLDPADDTGGLGGDDDDDSSANNDSGGLDGDDDDSAAGDDDDDLIADGGGLGNDNGAPPGDDPADDSENTPDLNGNDNGSEDDGTGFDGHNGTQLRVLYFGQVG